MSQENAKKTLWELLGTLEPTTYQGCVRLSIDPGQHWGERSNNRPNFYYWNGNFTVTAPEDILDPILLPIIKFAVMVGGVGRGWRRPLHKYWMTTENNEREASRGTYLRLTHEINSKMKLFGLRPQPEDWNLIYKRWRDAVQKEWPQRFQVPTSTISAEVFSPTTCAVYSVPGPQEEPIAFRDLSWENINAMDTRGRGMDLIYDPQYKRKIEVGGNAGRGGAHCSWVSIKRIKVRHPELNTSCQEIVCLFVGDENNLRSQVLKDLANIPGATHLFGVTPKS